MALSLSSVTCPQFVRSSCHVCGTEIPSSGLNASKSGEDITEILFRLLEVSHSICVENGEPSVAKRISACLGCREKLRRYEKLLLELEILQHEIASTLVNTLLQASALTDELSTPSPFNSFKNQILDKWNPTHGTYTESTPMTEVDSAMIQNDVATDALKLEVKDNKRIYSTTIPKSNLQNVGLLSWIANDVNIAAETESEAQDILQAYVTGSVVAVETLGGTRSEVIEVQEEVVQIDCFPDPVLGTAANTIGLSSDRVEEPVNAVTAIAVTKISKKRKSHESLCSANPVTGQLRKQPPPYFCERCGRVYSKFSTFRVHSKTCHAESGNDSISCPICNIVFTSWVILKYHIEKSHANITLDKCRFCKKEFLPFTIETHQCIHPVPSENSTLLTHGCDYCNKVYYKYTSLVEHVRRSHPDMQKFDCSVCRKHFVSKAARDKHQLTHPVTQDGKRTHVCTVCGIACTTAWGLREHTKLHTGSKPYACEICGKTFRLQNIKRNHMVVHTKEKNHECEFCGRKYSLYATMQRHWKKCKLPSAPRHGRWCPICQNSGSLFQKLSSLKTHMVKKHFGTKEQTEVCQEAGNFEFEPNVEIQRRKKKLSIYESHQDRSSSRVKNSVDETSHHETHPLKLEVVQGEFNFEPNEAHPHGKIKEQRIAQDKNQTILRRSRRKQRKNAREIS